MVILDNFLFLALGHIKEQHVLAPSPLTGPPVICVVEALLVDVGCVEPITKHSASDRREGWIDEESVHEDTHQVGGLGPMPEEGPVQVCASLDGSAKGLVLLGAAEFEDTFNSLSMRREQNVKKLFKGGRRLIILTCGCWLRWSCRCTA